MRLWSDEILDKLPSYQLVAQWRELGSIYTKQNRHILINYVYNYDKRPLLNYSRKVINEMYNRKFRIKSFVNYDKYFCDTFIKGDEKFKEHNKDYLLTCFMNLREKYKCGQKDFTDEEYANLRDYVYKRYNGKDGKITIDLYSENF